jgi:hypothetical protein
VIASTDVRAREAIPTLADLSFSAESFSLSIVAREPAVEFAATGMGPVSGGIVLPLDPIRAPVPDWWSAVLDALPVPGSDPLTDRWSRGALVVEARYDSVGDRATLAVIDTMRRYGWRVARIPSPAQRLYWIDTPADSMVRQALGRAFDEAALYSEDARTAARPVPHRRGGRAVRLAERTRASDEPGAGVLTRHAALTRHPTNP